MQQTNERLLIDACEFLNAIYEDMTQINELFSLKEMNTLLIEGVVMFHEGFQVVNTLEPRYLSQVLLKAKSYGLFDGGTVPQDLGREVFIDIFSLNRFERRAKEENEFQKISLMEDLVAQHEMDRFELHKKSAGEKTHLDETSSDSDLYDDPDQGTREPLSPTSFDSDKDSELESSDEENSEGETAKKRQSSTLG